MLGIPLSSEPVPEEAPEDPPLLPRTCCQQPTDHCLEVPLLGDLPEARELLREVIALQWQEAEEQLDTDNFEAIVWR